MVRKTIADRLGTTWIGFALNKLFGKIEFGMMKFYKDKETIKLFQQILTEESALLLRPSELYLIYSFARSQNHAQGDFAEVGVFKGTSAKLICEAKGDKTLHLFDTFAGLPQASHLDKKFKEGMFGAEIEYVRNRLARYDNVLFYKGLFPETAVPVRDVKFSFIHLDVDLYRSTRLGIEFFYPRMLPGGIMISHDFHTLGVRTAFDEFFKDKPEKIIELPMAQCMLVKN